MPTKRTTQPKMARRKSLPHNTQAEKAVLGAMLTDEKLCNDTFSVLENVDDFYDPNHQSIYAAMLKLRNKSPIDIQTVADELINANQLELIGGSEYLFDLASNYVGYENAKHCTEIVRDQALLRRFLGKINDVSEEYYNSEIDDINSFISDSERSILEVSKKRHVGGFKDSKEITNSLQNQIETMKKADEEGNIGVTTGFAQLNAVIHGFQPKQMIILAARTAVGKTSFGLNLCYKAAIKDNTVAYFSLEMSCEQLMTRIVSCESGVAQEKINLGTMSNQEKLAIKQACDTISKVKFFVDDTPGIKIADLIAKATKLKNDHPELGLIVVDYIGLVKLNDKVSASDSRQQIIQEVSQELKRLAMKLDVAIILVAQLNRNVEQRGDSATPMLSDLRESGSLEQDADVVLLMSAANFTTGGMNKRGKFSGEGGGNNEDGKQSALKNLMSKYDKSTSLVLIDVAKNRAGRQAQIYLLFKKDICRFIDPDPDFLQAIKNIKMGVLPSKEDLPTE